MILKKLDYVVKETSKVEIGTQITKTIEKLNSKQNSAANKINEDYKNLYYGTLFDTRSSTEYYLFCDLAKTTFALTSNYIKVSTTETTGGGTIDDTTIGANKTYSSQKINALIEAIKTSLTKVMKYKGSVDNLAALEALSDKELGDVYNLKDSGDNYAYDGTNWDKLGGAIDVSKFATKDEVDKISQLFSLGDVTIDDINDISGS